MSTYSRWGSALVDDSMQLVVTETQEEFPEFKLVPKSSSRFMKACNVGLLIITFGLMRSFMHTFTTTIGYTVYTPSRWPTWDWQSRSIIIRHERVHMRQRAQTSMVWYAIKYLLLWFPCVFAYFRMKYEMEAYEESMKADAEYYGGHILRSSEYRRRMIGHFTSAHYFWTWPWSRRIEEWYDTTVDRLLSG